ncbi:MAG: extracellular solute-binding protein [Cyanobacteria bacterium J06554_6]
MKRRTVLLGGTSALLTTAVGTACNRAARSSLEVQFLEQSLPLRVIKAFRSAQQNGARLSFEGESQLPALFRTLQSWQAEQLPQPPLWRRWLPAQPQPQPPDLLTLGDSWLQAAITQELIQPLPLADLTDWDKLPPAWQQLVRRNANGTPDQSGKLWGAPYRVQPLVIAYSPRAVQALGSPPVGWNDLLDPALQGRVALPAQPHLIASIVLKSLGQPLKDLSTLTAEPGARQLTAFLSQARGFDSSTSLKALINEDVWAVVGWSGDVLATLQRYRQLKGSFPQEGTLWSTDLWVRPASAQAAVSLATDWMTFCWQPSTALQISLSSNGIAPRYLQNDRPDELANQTLLLPEADEIDRSELMPPLSAADEANLSGAFAAARKG